MKKPTVIIGAGLAGLAAASRLKGRVLIFEAADAVGGVARTYEKEGFRYDLGPHVLYFNNGEIKHWVERMLDGKWVLHERRARIWFDGETVDYPVQEGFLRSPRLRKRFLQDLLEANGAKKGAFRESARNLYGKALAEAFFIPYNKKLWQYPLDDMDHSWVQRFMPSFPRKDLELAAKGKNPPRGANAGFYYPAGGGIGRLADALAAKAADIQLNKRIKYVSVNERWAETCNGERFGWRNLISTVPLPELVKMCVDLPPETRILASTLKSVGMVFIHLGFEHPLKDDSHWIYYSDPAIIFHRISIPWNYCHTMVPEGKGSLVAEIAYPSEEEANIPELIRITKDAVVKLGFSKEQKRFVAEDVKVSHYAYIFPTPESEGARRKLSDILKSRNIHPAGRYAMWEYGNMESAILQGFKAASRMGQND